MTSSIDHLRLNVGFIVHQDIGFSRDFDFNIPSLQLQPDINLANFTGRVRITRTTQGLLVQGRMCADTQMECVRCLEPYSQRLEIEITELYAFSPEEVEESGFLLPEDEQIDLSALVREEMMLAIPLKPLCRSDCEGLCPVCGENRNTILCDHIDQQIDPRLAGLRELLNEEPE